MAKLIIFVNMNSKYFSDKKMPQIKIKNRDDLVYEERRKQVKHEIATFIILLMLLFGHGETRVPTLTKEVSFFLRGGGKKKKRTLQKKQSRIRSKQSIATFFHTFHFHWSI